MRSRHRLGLLGMAALLLVSGCSGQDSDSARLWVSDERGNAVIVIDPAGWTVERRIAIGKRPRAIQTSADGRRLYVALSGSAIGGPDVDESKLPPPDRKADGIAVLNSASGQVERIIKAGNDPETFAISPDGGTLYVANEDSGLLSVIDVATGGIRAAITVGDEPEGIGVSADGKLVFVACEASDAVHVVSPSARRSVAVIPVAGRPRTILVSRDGKRAYVAVEVSGELAVIDTATLKVADIFPLPAGNGGRARPMGLVEQADGKLLVSTGRTGEILEVDPDARRIVRRLTGVGQRPWGIALNREGTRLFTANGPSGDITEIDVKGWKIVRRLPAGTSPWGVATTGM